MIRRKQLPPLPYSPRDYQQEAYQWGIDHALNHPGEWGLTVSPTGTGKSTWELMWLCDIPDSVLVTPRIEIIRGLLQKIGYPHLEPADLVSTAQEFGIFTPIRFRNILARGELAYAPTVCILDECHHSEADSWQDIDMYLNKITVLGATASPFRGTPKGTEAFRNRWKRVHYALTLSKAVEQGYCAFPSVEIWPLIDDDVIEVNNGELKISTCSNMVADNITNLVDRCKVFYDRRGRAWDRPTMFSVPTTDAAYALAEALKQAGLPAHAVTQSTRQEMRERVFQSTIDQYTALVQIDVISEGVDLPIRRLIDCRPTLSPVKWLQQVGRIMRPTEIPPEYICVCRNVERHGYLMEGLLPNSALKEAQEAFKDSNGNPIYSRRSGSRALGLEGLGRFVAAPIHLLNGLTGFLYNLVHMDGYTRVEYAVFMLPNQPEVLYAERRSARKPTIPGYPPEYDWGRWKAIPQLPDLKGCHSARPRELTTAQRNRWKEDAERLGLNPHKQVDEKQFQLLFVLKNLGVKL